MSCTRLRLHVRCTTCLLFNCRYFIRQEYNFFEMFERQTSGTGRALDYCTLVYNKNDDEV